MQFSHIFFYLNACILGHFRAILPTLLEKSNYLFLNSNTIHLNILMNPISTSDHCRLKMTFQCSSMLRSDPNPAFSIVTTIILSCFRRFTYTYLRFASLWNFYSITTHFQLFFSIIGCCDFCSQVNYFRSFTYSTIRTGS